MENPILNLNCTLWRDQAYVKANIKSGVPMHERSKDLYCLTNKEFKHYELNITYYYESDIDDRYTKEDVTIELDPIGFWAYTDKPVKELAERLASFENAMSSTIETLKQSTSIFGLTMKSLPKERCDRFFDDLLCAWVSSIDACLLKIPEDYTQAIDHIEGLQYKFRKMIELWESVYNSDMGLYEYLKQKCLK